MKKQRSEVRGQRSVSRFLLLAAFCLLLTVSAACGPDRPSLKSQVSSPIVPIDGPIDPCEGNVCAPPKATPSPTPAPEFKCFYVIVDGEKRLVCE